MDFKNIFSVAWDCFTKDLKFFLVSGIVYTVLAVLSYVSDSVTVLIVSVVLMPYVMMSLIRASIASVRGETVDFSLFKNNWKKFIIYYVTALLLSIIIMIGTILIIVPGVICAVMFAFAIYLIIDKDINIVDAFKKSAEITKGSRWHILLLFIILAFISVFGNVVIIGTIVTVPYATLMMAKAYESLNKPAAAI
jgi:uncharacterized membrane protein